MLSLKFRPIIKCGRFQLLMVDDSVILPNVGVSKIALGQSHLWLSGVEYGKDMK